MRSMRDERGVIVGWLVRILLGLAILGVVVYDGGSILVNFFGLDNAADEIALEISTELASGTTYQGRQLEDRARELAAQHDARLVKAGIDHEGIVHVKLRRRAETLIVGRVGPIKDWARSTAEATAGTKPST